jgi:hypothetical protein
LSKCFFKGSKEQIRKVFKTLRIYQWAEHWNTVKTAYIISSQGLLRITKKSQINNFELLQAPLVGSKKRKLMKQVQHGALEARGILIN